MLGGGAEGNVGVESLTGESGRLGSAVPADKRSHAENHVELRPRAGTPPATGVRPCPGQPVGSRFAIKAALPAPCAQVPHHLDHRQEQRHDQAAHHQ